MPCYEELINIRIILMLYLVLLWWTLQKSTFKNHPVEFLNPMRSTGFVFVNTVNEFLIHLKQLNQKINYSLLNSFFFLVFFYLKTLKLNSKLLIIIFVQPYVIKL